MNHSWRHRLRRLRFALAGLLAALPILLAMLMALGQLLLPLAAHYPQRVADFLSQRLQRPVSFASMDGHWQPSGPLLILHDVRIGAPGNGHALRLPTAEVKLDFGALLRPSRHWVNLRLSGLKLELERDLHGAWHVAGFGSAGAGTARISLADLPGNLLLGDLQLGITDVRSQHRYRLRVDPLRISNNGQRVRFAGLVYRSEHGGAVRMGGQFSATGNAGRLYVGAADMDVGRWARDIDAGAYALRSARGDFDIWLDWRDGRPDGLTARLDLTDVRMRGPGGTVALPALRGLWQYRREAGHARFRYAGSAHSAARVDIDGMGARARISARARALDLGVVLPLVSLLPQVSPGTARWLVAARPHGQVQSASLQWRQGTGVQALQAQLRGVGFAAVGKHPGIDHVDARVSGDAEALMLSLPQQALTLDFGHSFRKPFALSALSGDVVVWRDDAAWHVGSDALDFSGDGFAGQARGEVTLAAAGGAPFVDVYARVQAGDITTAKLFWPDSMPASTVHWLDRALIAGTLDHGDVVVRGDLADWPFRGHKGRFEARGVIADLTLDYSPAWPRASHVDAIASFVDTGMLVESSRAQSLGVHVRRAVAAIPDFAEPHLLLSAQGMATGSGLFDLLRASPVVARQRQALRKLTVSGDSEFGFDLDIPLRDTPAFRLAGNVVLARTAVDNDDWNLHLAQLRGRLDFDRDGFSAPRLDTLLHGQPATLAIAVGGATGDPQRQLDARLHGHFSVAQLVQGYPSLAALGDLATGQAEFDVGYTIAAAPPAAPASPAPAGAPAAASSAAAAIAAGPPPGASAVQTLSVDSDLHGIALKLPAPLDKAASANLPLHLQLGLPTAGSRLRVALGDIVHARARLPLAADGALAADIALGRDAPNAAPPPGVRVHGHARRLDVSGWISRVLGMHGDAGHGLRQVIVDADIAEVFGKRFADMHLQLQPGVRQIVLAVASAQMAGTLSLPQDDLSTRGVLARFQRLYWPDQPAPPSPALARAASTAAPAASTAESAAATKEDAAATGVDPKQLPPLHLWVGDLRLGKARLGEARFESWPTAKGMHIDQLRTQSPSVHVSASGEWDGDAANSRTHMAIDFSAANLGRMLDALGFEGLFNGGRTRARLDATWPGAPSSLALANMDGTLTVDIGKGRIPEVTPGMGRLFGLMSIAELPRRLSLDFGDVFGKGFGFDSIKGSFRLADGNAHTDDLTIKGSAAEITVQGRTGLRAHDYDQRVHVVPHVGNSLPLVGAVVGGPIGVAAGLAVQGLLGKGLNKAASARYRISGSWDKPVITLLEKHLPPPPPLPSATSIGLAPMSPIAVPAPVPPTSAPAPARTAGGPPP